MAGKKGMRQREKVMYDPYNFAAVTEKFRAEQEAEKQAAKQAKQRDSKQKAERTAFKKLDRSQRKITTELSKQIKGGQRQLDKQVKRLEKTTVTGPLGGEIKVKTLKKISSGAPGLDKGIRSKRYIGKKFNMGGVMRNRGGTFKGVY